MSMEEALQAQQQEPKKIIMDAYTVWCGPCKMMDKHTFGNPDVIQYINQNYYAVKFNAEGNDSLQYKGHTFTNPQYDPARKNGRNFQHTFARTLKISGYPSIVFFDEKANLITPLVGYRAPKDIEIYLKLFAGDDYKKIQSDKEWNAYLKNFSPAFTD